MNATRILPDLQCSLLCEDIRLEANGGIILVGVLDVIRTQQLPVIAHKVCVFNRWTAGVGSFTETVRVIAPDQTTVLRSSEMKFALQDPARAWTNLNVFPQMQFTASGVYQVEVLVDDVMRLRYPVPLVVVQPPPGAAPQGKPEGSGK